MSRRILNIVAISALFAAAAWVFGWLVYAALFTHPNAEDLSLSHPTFTTGRWQFIKHTLATYDGRYFINLMHTLTPLSFKWMAGYPLVAIGGLLVIVASLSWFLHAILLVSRFHAFTIAVVAMAIHFATVPSLPHQLYWMSSSMVYLWCWVFFLLFMASMFRMLQSLTEPAKTAYLVIACLSLTACLGTNEMMLPVAVLFIVYLLITYRKHTAFQVLLFTAALAAIWVLFFVSSPGISERLLQEEMIRGKPATIGKVVLHYFTCYKTYFFSFINSPAMAGFLVILSAGKYRFRAIISDWVNTPVTVLFVLPALATITLPYFLPLAESTNYPERIFGCAQIAALVAAILLAIQLGRQFTFPAFLKPVTAVVLLGWLAAGSGTNIAAIIQEFKNGSAYKFHSEMQQRDKLLSEAARTNTPHRSAIIPPVTVFPKSTHITTDILPNRSAAHWNQAYEMFYGIDRISLSTDTINNTKPL